jgi:hypothetical protein
VNLYEVIRSRQQEQAIKERWPLPELFALIAKKKSAR